MELTSQHESLYKGFLEALLCSVLIVLITFVVPEHAKFLFTRPEGYLLILPHVGPLLALAFLLRWRHSRRIALAVFISLTPMLIYSALTVGQPFIGHGVILILNVALVYLLVSRRDLRVYLREE